MDINFNVIKKQMHKGSAMFFSVIFACVVVGILALKSTVMSDVSFRAFTVSGDTTIAQEYALSRIETLRQVKYSSLVNMPVVAIPGSRNFYEEVIVSDSTTNVVATSGDAVIGCKEVVVNIYKGNDVERRLCTSLKFNRIDPSSFDEAFGMVANDFESDSHTKAMSADAFHDLVDSKISDDKNYSDDDKTLSARAFKEYLSDRLKVYAKTTESVWHNEGVAVGNAYRGFYVASDGSANACNVIYRGKRTNDSNALIIVPSKGSDGIWYFDYIKRSDLYKKYLDQLYFTLSIEQTPHQTITVTTSDGVKHTSSFRVKYGETWTATIEAEIGYIVGTLEATSGTVKGATTVKASAAVLDTRLYGFEIGNAGGGTNTFYDCPSKTAYVGVPVGTDRRYTECRFLPSPYSNLVINGSNVSFSFRAPANCTMIAIQYTWHWGGDEDPYCFSVVANGKQWWNNSFAGSWYSGPVGRLNNGNPANFVKVTPGKTYNISFSGHHGYKSRNYGLRFYWGAQINSSNYAVRVNAD